MAADHAGAVFADPWPVTDPASCHFYHTMDLPGLGTFDGHVDLRPGLAAYLGGVEVAGRRVLDVGPASGAVTFHLERAGAREVVGLEVSEERGWQAVPQPDLDMDAVLADRVEHLRRIKRGFWLAHGTLGASARMIYGDVNRPPPGLGRVDVAVLGGVLLHCRDPLGALAACCALSDEAVVVTEQEMPSLQPSREAAVQLLAPSRANQVWDVWWRFTPGVFAQALPLFGFPDVETRYHAQLSQGAWYPHFSVVGRRG